jgi:hypothetical protein
MLSHAVDTAGNSVSALSRARRPTCRVGSRFVPPDDLLLLPRPENGKHYELSEGEPIVGGSPGWRHEGGGARILYVAFVSHGKLALLPDEDIAIPFAPDLAIEIISNSEIAARAEKKVREYLASGVQEVWQVYRRIDLRPNRLTPSSLSYHSTKPITSPLPQPPPDIPDRSNRP